MMVRILSFKCLLLIMMIVVIGLTLGFISRCTSSAPLTFGLVNSHHKPPDDKKDDDAFNYYQSINEEEQKAYPPEGNYLKKPKFSKYLQSNPKDEDGRRRSGGDGGLDYPFEEDDSNKHQEDELEGYKDPKDKRLNSNSNQKGKEVTNVVCNINNGKYKIGCKKDQSEVYIPFSFIHKHFEIYGKLEDSKEGEEQVFTWLHSQVKIYRPKAPYNPKGIFSYFENYNVEVRDRVKCISGAEGVPVSTQWDINGYFYPIQIAQFGLSHFSKFLTEGEPKKIILEDADETRGGWIPAENLDILPTDSDPTMNHYVQIKTPANSGNFSVKLSIGATKPRMLVLSWQMRVINGGQFPNVTLTATVRYDAEVFYLHYVTADFLIQAKDNHIYHGLGYHSTSSWHHLIRDLGVDVHKGVNFQYQSIRKSKIPKIPKSKLQLESISVTSSIPSTLIFLDNLTLSTNEHLAQFFQAADWFVSHQDSRGGWPIPVRRKFGPDFYPVLEPGWYSAMAQGHALSLLSRAYSVTTNNTLYGETCAKAVSSIFDNPGNDYGVRAVFLDKFVWYEEYPTTPGSFVLNGFMYALLGLYDVKALEVVGAWEKAKELYDLGLISLKTMLPLYDTGSGTMYDLRHFSVSGISPNLARLDYHVTHINQLLTFATFEKDSSFKSTAERWIGYTEGNRAAHN